MWIIILAISLSRRTILDLGRQGKFETSEKCRSKLGHWSPYRFLLPSSCTLFIVRKWSYTFLWGGTAEQAHGFKMDPRFPHGSAYGGTRHLAAQSNRKWLEFGAGWAQGGRTELRPPLWVWAEGRWIMELAMTVSGLPTSGGTSMGFVDTGGVNTALLSGKREADLSWAIATWWGGSAPVTTQEACPESELWESVPCKQVISICHHCCSSP